MKLRSRKPYLTRSEYVARIEQSEIRGTCHYGPRISLCSIRATLDNQAQASAIHIRFFFW